MSDIRAHLLEKRWFYATLLTSLWMVIAALLSDPVINLDGMYYIDQARTLLEGGQVQATRWALFSRLLAALASLAHLDPLDVALLLVVAVRVASAALLYVWVSAIYRSAWPGLAFVLAVSLPWAVSYQGYVIRDSFAWLALIGCLLCAMHFARSGQWRWFLLMLPTIALGVLSRTEMLVLCVIPVWLLLCLSWRRGPRATLAVLLVATAVAAVLLMLGRDMILGHINFYLDALRDSPRFMFYPELVEKLSAHVHGYARSDFATVLAVGLAALPLLKLANLLGVYLLPLGMALASRTSRQQANVDQGASLMAFAGFVLVLLAFVYAMQFLSTRYAVPAAICLVPWIALGMQRMWAGYPRLARTFIVLVLMMAVSSSLTLTSSKYLLRDLGSYIEKHEEDVAPTYFTDHRVAFYAHQPYISEATGPLPEDDNVLAAYRSLVVTFRMDAEEAAPWLQSLQHRYGFTRVAYVRDDDGKLGVALLVR